MSSTLKTPILSPFMLPFFPNPVPFLEWILRWILPWHWPGSPDCLSVWDQRSRSSHFSFHSAHFSGSRERARGLILIVWPCTRHTWQHVSISCQPSLILYLSPIYLLTVGNCNRWCSLFCDPFFYHDQNFVHRSWLFIWLEIYIFVESLMLIFLKHWHFVTHKFCTCQMAPMIWLRAVL